MKQNKKDQNSSAVGGVDNTTSTNDNYNKYKNVLKTKLNSLGSDVRNFIVNGLGPNSPNYNNINNNNNNGNSPPRYGGADLDESVIEISPPPPPPLQPQSHSSSSKPSQQQKVTKLLPPISKSSKLWTCRSCTFAANPDWQKCRKYYSSIRFIE